MKNITKNIFNSLNESSSGNTIKEYAINYLGGFIDNDVSDTEIDMMVAFSFDFNDEPDADFKEYSRFMNLIAERTKIVKVRDSEYGASLVCDFSSVLKPYNEEWKDFFNMDYSDFDEEDAWAEAVVNLEPLISGNAGNSTYKEFCDIIEGKNKDGNVVANEADNMESIIDEAARYLFDEGDKDYLPDYEEFNEYTMEIPRDLFDKAKERALKALGNLAEHSYYDHENHGPTYLELNDNHTIWELESDEDMPYDDEGYTLLVQNAADEFKEKTGTEMYFLGRMARHVCVDATYDNCMNFDYLQELQEELEQGVIDAYNADMKKWKAERDKENEEPMNESMQTKYDSVMIDVEEFEPIPVCYNLNKPMTDKELISYINKNDYALDKIGTEVSEKELKGKTYKCNLMMNESNVDDALNRMKQAGEEVANIDKNTGIRKKQLEDNIYDIVCTYDNGISDGYEEPFKTEEEMINYVYNDVFDQKSDGNGSTRYGKGICKDLKYLGKDYIVSEIIRIGNEVGIVEKPINEEVENNLYIYSNAESEDRSDAESMIDAQYSSEAPNLKFKMHSEGPMWFVDFIGSKEDIINYLVKLGWYTKEEAEEQVKPYKMNESNFDGDPDLDAEQVQADVDYWSDVDEAETEDVSNAEPIGVYTLSNTGAIFIYQIEYDIQDKVLAGDSSDTTKAKWRDILYDNDENATPYFYYGSIKVPFNEVMRTDI